MTEAIFKIQSIKKYAKSTRKCQLFCTIYVCVCVCKCVCVCMCVFVCVSACVSVLSGKKGDISYVQTCDKCAEQTLVYISFQGTFPPQFYSFVRNYENGQSTAIRLPHRNSCLRNRNTPRDCIRNKKNKNIFRRRRNRRCHCRCCF